MYNSVSYLRLHVELLLSRHSWSVAGINQLKVQDFKWENKTKPRVLF